MTIYTPQELADPMQKRIAEGYYQPDHKMVVTIWVAKDVRSPPAGFRPNDPRIVASWASWPDPPCRKMLEQDSDYE